MFRIEGKKRKSLEQRRSSLVEILQIELETFKSPVSVVFDSSEQVRDYAQKAIIRKHLEILYAPRGQTADDYIIELVEQSKNPRLITVVSSDTGLTRQCLHLGSRALAIEDFIVYVIKKGKKKSTIKPPFKLTNPEKERFIKAFEKKTKD